MKLGDFAAKLDIAMRDLDAGARSGMNRVTGRHLERYVELGRKVSEFHAISSPPSGISACET